MNHSEEIDHLVKWLSRVDVDVLNLQESADQRIVRLAKRVGMLEEHNALLVRVARRILTGTEDDLSDDDYEALKALELDE